MLAVTGYDAKLIAYGVIAAVAVLGVGLRRLKNRRSDRRD